MNNPFLIGITAWLLPGAGHFLQGKKLTGALVAGSIWIMVIVGVISGGAYYPGFSYQDGPLLYLLNAFARSGNGIGLIITYLFSLTPSPNAAALATFEYGGKFLEAAGLLNFLALIDALDIHFGRKK